MMPVTKVRWSRCSRRIDRQILNQKPDIHLHDCISELRLRRCCWTRNKQGAILVQKFNNELELMGRYFFFLHNGSRLQAHQAVDRASVLEERGKIIWINSRIPIPQEAITAAIEIDHLVIVLAVEHGKVGKQSC